MLRIFLAAVKPEKKDLVLLSWQIKSESSLNSTLLGRRGMWIQIASDNELITWQPNGMSPQSMWKYVPVKCLERVRFWG